MNEPLDPKKLRRWMAKQEITELIHAYCNAVDRRDQDKLRQLYHEDAIDEHAPFFTGPAREFVDQFHEISAPMEILQHNVTTVNLEVEGDYAEGEVYILAFHKARTEEGAVDVLVGGRYLDKYEKRDGAWRFSHRMIVTDWVNIHRPSRVDLDDPFVEGSKLGKPGFEDPSYAFFSLLQRGS